MDKPAVIRDGDPLRRRRASAATGSQFRRLAFAVAVFATMFFWDQTTAFAATFELKDGDQIEGEIIFASSSSIIVRKQTGTLAQLSRHAIDNIKLVTEKRGVLSGSLVSWNDGVYEIKIDDTVFTVQLSKIIDEREDVPRIKVTSAQEKENAEKLVFELNLSTSVKQEVILIYSTVDGTALAGSDYEAQRGSLILKPGTTGTTVGVPLLDDELAEDDETFELLVTSDLDSATIEVERGSATILDNDAPANDNQ